jgi:hypothetical protein
VGGRGGTFIRLKNNMDDYPFIKMGHPKKAQEITES